MKPPEPFAHVDPGRAGEAARATALLSLDLLIGAGQAAHEAGRFKEAALAARDMADGIGAIARHLSRRWEPPRR